MDLTGEGRKVEIEVLPKLCPSTIVCKTKSHSVLIREVVGLNLDRVPAVPQRPDDGGSKHL
jgi:hypothetical protein